MIDNYFINSFTICYVVFVILSIYLYHFYSRVKRYPSGPLPFPFIGNLSLFAKHVDIHPTLTLVNLSKKYGKVFTVWFGSKPFVILSDYQISKYVLSRCDLTQRTERPMQTQIAECAAFMDDVPLFVMDYDGECRLLRKFGAEAIKKFSAANQLADTVRQIVDEAVEAIKHNECGKPFDPNMYVCYISIAIMFRLAYGKHYPVCSQEVALIARGFEIFQSQLSGLQLADCLPVLKPFQRRSQNANLSVNNAINDLHAKNFCDNLRRSGEENDGQISFCDLLLNIRNKALNDNKELANHLSENNIIRLIKSLFFAGSDTSHYALKWMLLFLAYYPKMQIKMRKEIANNIGHRIPDLTDKTKCHFVNAFICETLRFRSPSSLTFDYIASNDIKIENYSIPKGSRILLNQFAVCNDPNDWSDPSDFNPKRFLDCDNQFITTRMAAFVPFGLGKRICIGDKLAMDMLFLVLIRLLQSTDGYQFVLSDASPANALLPASSGVFFEPNKHRIILRQNS